MADTFIIRDARPEDTAAILGFYPLAFPEEDLVPVAQELLSGGDEFLSLVAEKNGEVVGHVSYSLCGVEGAENSIYLLAPLAVTPALHKQGIGTALIKEGIARAKATGFKKMMVFGDPAYYGRTGFVTDSAITTPCPIPAEYEPGWQSIALSDDAESLSGVLKVPAIWQKPSLWGG
ncbi:N-acetyltransferase [Rhodobacteraceae bacterium RKSG542]|uniref:GNAT family N-acetyltransferase n=1 Tax=Pseudovibrio flavus TaxID=2529854 RepID=UPI0012BC7BDD|nr:N-acetyltransferase [Pseudovibrio flavus]MTI19063.1 N-acetyltransferase [Pseudovibrio flavus]